MSRAVSIIEMIVAVLLTVSILLQNRGAGLSATFGGDFGGYYTRRGMEKFLLVLSAILSAVFIFLAILQLVISKQ